MLPDRIQHVYLVDWVEQKFLQDFILSVYVLVEGGGGMCVYVGMHVCVIINSFSAWFLLKLKKEHKAMEPTHILRAGFSFFRVTNYVHHISVANTEIAAWKINRKGSSSSVLPQTSMTLAKTSRRVQNNVAQPERVPGSR